MHLEDTKGPFLSQARIRPFYTLQTNILQGPAQTYLEHAL